MKTLLLMRHAKSSWSNQNLSDFDRSLNHRGVDAAIKMGRLISERDLIPDVIISSSSKRTRQTVDLFLEECPFSGEVHFTRNLYHGGPADMVESVQQWGGDFARVMVVGHNPGMEYALDEFSGVNERMVTAAIAEIIFELETWKELSDEIQGSLVNLWRPREI